MTCPYCHSRPISKRIGTTDLGYGVFRCSGCRRKFNEGSVRTWFQSSRKSSAATLCLKETGNRRPGRIRNMPIETPEQGSSRSCHGRKRRVSAHDGAASADHLADPVRCGRVIDSVRQPGVRHDGVVHRLHESRPPGLLGRPVFVGMVGRLCRATDECATDGNRKRKKREHDAESALRRR
jgi:transposase-like protein